MVSVESLLAAAGIREILRTDRKQIIILMVITLACLLPFIGKAFHIDDPLFIWSGKQIIEHPFDPYGFSLNWFGTQMPMSVIMRNPPLTPYYLALAGGLTSWSETGIHLFFLLPALASIAGIYLLARYWSSNPFLAALISLFTPALLVSSTTVMCDGMMLAFEVWALVAWIRAHDTKSVRLFLISALLLTAGVLTKFTGLTLLPLFLAYSIVREKRIIGNTFSLVIPLAGLMVYLFWFKNLYGGDSMWDSLTYATAQGSGKTFTWQTVVVSLSFLGGCFLPVLFFAPLLFRWKTVAAGSLVVTAILVQVLAGDLFSGIELQKVSIADPVLSVQLILFVTTGVLLLVLAVLSVIRDRGAVPVTIGLLVLGTVVFTTVISWSVSARYLLPVTPVIGILIVRFLGERARLTWVYVLLIIPAAISIMAAAADYSAASSARAAADDLCGQYKNTYTSLWFQGHWGFQYYMDGYGAKPLDGQYPAIQPNEILIYPGNNSTFRMDNSTVRQREKRVYPVTGFIATMSPSVGAGFYSQARGPFPFAFGNVEKETYYVLRFVGRPLP